MTTEVESEPQLESEKWQWTTVEEVTTVCRRGRSPAYEGGTTPVINQKCVRKKTQVDLSFVKQTNEATRELPDWATLRPGDVLVNSTGTGTLGRVGWLRHPSERTTFDSHVSLLRPNADLVRPAFLGWFLHSHEDQLVSLGSGSTNQRELSPDSIKKISIPLPPLEAQDAVVSAIERLLHGVEDGEMQLVSAQRNLQRMRATVLRDLATEDVPRVSIGEVGEVFVGATPSRKRPELWGGDVPWVSSGEVAFGRISATRETITREGLGNSAKRLHPPGTVMLAMIGEGKTRGQAAILDVAAAHNQNSAAIRLDPSRMLPEYLFLWLMRSYHANRQQAGGSQQPALNGRLVRGMSVPCPPMALQRIAVGRAERGLAIAADLERDIQSRLRQIASLRQSILNRAFSGRLATAEGHLGEPFAARA
jgi:restriction endonuclease S subunit